MKGRVGYSDITERDFRETDAEKVLMSISEDHPGAAAETQR